MKATLLVLVLINLRPTESNEPKFAVCACPQEVYTGPYGKLQSPNYPEEYCNNVDCVYRITVPQQYIVLLEFVDFETQKDKDVVTIYDGESIDNENSLISK